MKTNIIIEKFTDEIKMKNYLEMMTNDLILDDEFDNFKGYCIEATQCIRENQNIDMKLKGNFILNIAEVGHKIGIFYNRIIEENKETIIIDIDYKY